MVEFGEGFPIVLVPGIQGRWEWIRPAVQALAAHHRVLTFSLSGDRGSESAVEDETGLDNEVRQIDRALDSRTLASAVMCGISYGGVIAVRYAAVRPRRTRALILASTPGPGWTPDARIRGYVDQPLWSTPAFIARAPGRLWPEVRAARQTRAGALAFLAGHAIRALLAPMRPRLMAQRIGALERADLAADARRVTAPTLVITGEPRLDRVVRVDSSRELARMIPGARLATLERTGHIGSITRPHEFAALVGEFVASAAVQNVEHGDHGDH